MTISNFPPRVQLLADGSTGPFPFEFKIFEDEDLRVFNGPALLVFGVDYTIEFDYEDPEAETGSIDFITGRQPTAGSVLTLDRRVVSSRDEDFQQSGPPIQRPLNVGLDRLWAKVQEINDQFLRLVRLSDTTVFTGDVILPDGEPDKVIAWNDRGDGLENVDVRDFGDVTLPLSIANGGTAGTSAFQARTNLVVPGLTTRNFFTAPNIFRQSTLFQVIDDTSIDFGRIFLDRESASPAPNDSLPTIRFRGRNDVGELVEFARLRTVVENVIDGQEEARYEIITRNAGAFRVNAQFGEGLFFPGVPGTDQGPATVNALRYFKSGREVGKYHTVVNEALPSAASDVVTGIDISDYADIVITVDDMSATANGEFRLSFGDATDYTTGVISKGITRDEQGATTLWSGSIGIPILVGSNLADFSSGGFHMRRMPDAIAVAMFGAGYKGWYVSGVVNSTNNINNIGWGGGVYATPKDVDRARLLTTVGVFDSGHWALMAR